MSRPRAVRRPSIVAGVPVPVPFAAARGFGMLLAAPLAALVTTAAAQSVDGQPATVLDTVVVTATRHPMLEVDAPAAMTVITRRDIEARGADNVLDAVRGDTGLSLQGRSIGGRKVISIRGMDSRHTLFLVDGRRISASDGVIGHTDFQYDWIAMDDVERIEVVRGPMSVLYGSEAMGGVVNIITRQPGDRWRFGASIEGAWAAGGRGGDENRASVRADGPLGAGLSLRAGVAQSDREALASVEDPRLSELESRDKRDGWIGLNWRASDRHRFDIEHREGTEERWAAARERSGARRYHETVNDIERSLTTLGWDAQWGGKYGLVTQLRAYRSEIDVKNPRTAGVTPNPPQRIGDKVLEGQARLRLGGHGLTSGFEARGETLHDPGLDGGEQTVQHRALFLQDEFALAQRLSATIGLRYDHHELFGSEWSPRAYLVWRATDRWTVKGGYSHGFKAPNLKQILPGGRREGPNVVMGNADLRPESSDGFEVGVGYSWEGREAQLVLFDQRVKDLIDLRLVAAGTVPGTGTYAYENLHRARMRGIEASYGQPLGAGFIALVSYTYLDARDGDGERLERRPRHSVSGRLDWQRGLWRAGLRAEHAANQWLPATLAGADSERAPGVTLVGAHLARKLPAGLELALVVDNLTNVRLAEKSPLFTHVELPRTVRVILRGQW